MTTGDAFILGALFGQVLVIVAIVAGRALAARLVSSIVVEVEHVPPPPVPTQEEAAHAPQPTESELLDGNPYTNAPALWQRGERTVVTPAVIDGDLAGIVFVDTLTAASTSQPLYDTEPPEDPHA